MLSGLNRFSLSFALLFLWQGSVSAGDFELKLETTIGGKGMRYGYSMTHLVPHPDGKRLMGSARDGTVRLWDLEKNEEIRRYTVPAGKPYWNAQLHPDGKRLLSAEDDGYIRLWDLQKKDPVSEFNNGSRVFRLAVFPDGLKFLAGDSGNKVSIWDFNKLEKPIATMEGHSDDVYAVAVSTDGKTGWSGGDDNKLFTWDLEKQKVIGKAKTFGDDVHTLAASPDGQWLLVVVDGGKLSLFDANTMKTKWEKTFKSNGDVAAWTPDSKAIVTSGKMLEIIDVDTGNVLRSIPLNGDSHTPVAVSADGKEIFSGERMIFRHDFETGKRIFPPEDETVLKGEIVSVAVSNTGKLYVATGYQMEVWNVDNERERVIKFEDDVRVIRLSGDESQVAVGTDKNAVHILQAKDGKEIAKLPTKRQVRQMEFVGKNRILVNTGSSQASVLSIKTGETMYSFTQSSLDRIAVSPDALRLVTASDGKPLQVWDAQTGKSMGSFSLPEGAATVAGTAFLADSKSILVVGKLKLSGALYKEKKVKRPISEAEFTKLIEALGQSNFWARELASRKLVEFGASILPMLETAKGTNKEGEYRLRLVANSLRESLKPSALETILEHDSNFSNLLIHPTKPVWVATSGTNPARGQVLFGTFSEGKPVILQKLSGGRGPNALSFDKTGNRLAVANDDGTVTVYQITTVND